ncbi:MAG: YopX family protein [Bacilli bacterium]
MNNMNGFRIWDKEKKKMRTSNIESNNFLIDGCGNLFQRSLHKIRVIPPILAKERYVILLSLDRYDISGRTVFEGDILRYETGYEFVVAFGTHPSFCPGDRLDTTNEGFCALTYEDGKTIANSFNAYPLSDVEHLALVVGNIYEGYLYEN